MLYSISLQISRDNNKTNAKTSILSAFFIGGSDLLSSKAREFIADFNNELLISLATLWEIAIKTSLGKLELLSPFEQLIPEQLEQNAIGVLPIEVGHISKIIGLEFHHRDPFDRLIIAQGICEQIPVVTSGGLFAKYPVEVIW